MMRMKRVLLAGSLVAILGLGASQMMGQGNQGGGQGRGPGGPGGGFGGPGGRPGNWDPAQMRQFRMDRYKEQLEVTDETEWKVIQPLVQKVLDARDALMSSMARGMFGRGPRPGGDNAGDANRQRFGPQPSPEAENLQRAIDSKASSADLKGALEKYVESRKKNMADLEKAQADLRKVLTPRQEAIATLASLL